MSDPLAVLLTATPARAWTMTPVALVAGAASSIGPCVAPRYVAVIALVQQPRALRAVATFVAGLVVAFVAIGLGADVLMTVVAHRAWIDLALAAGLVAYGVATILREPASCAHGNPPPTTASGAFALGAGTALIVSPCCTPVALALAALGAMAGTAWQTALLLGAFAIGHALPLVVVGIVGTAAAERLRDIAAGTVVTTVSGTLAVGLGGLYGLLA